MRRPKILRASDTAACATDTAPSPTAVSVRTRLPTANDVWNRRVSSGPTDWRSAATWNASFTCPRICGSPTTSESRPAATRNRCSAAVVPSCIEQVRQERRGRQVVVDSRNSTISRRARSTSSLDDVDLRPVAGREHHRFSRRRPRRQGLDGRAHVAAREVEPLAQVDRRRLVAYAEQRRCIGVDRDGRRWRVRHHWKV